MLAFPVLISQAYSDDTFQASIQLVDVLQYVLEALPECELGCSDS